MKRTYAPKYIYLQWHGDEKEPKREPVDTEDVTWCQHRMFDRDIKYKRVDEPEED